MNQKIGDDRNFGFIEIYLRIFKLVLTWKSIEISKNSDISHRFIISEQVFFTQVILLIVILGATIPSNMAKPTYFVSPYYSPYYVTPAYSYVHSYSYPYYGSYYGNHYGK